MEIKIINSNDFKSKCTLFNLVNPQPMFLDLTTDAGVSVSFNGDDTGKSMIEFVDSLVSNAFEFKKIEWYAGDDFYYNGFTILKSDANGHYIIGQIVEPMIYLSPKQITKYPIIIPFEKEYLVTNISNNKEQIKHTLTINNTINFRTSYLFTLEPKQEITLKFIK